MKRETWTPEDQSLLEMEFPTRKTDIVYSVIGTAGVIFLLILALLLAG